MPAVVIGESTDVDMVMQAWKFDEIKEGVFTINLSANQVYDLSKRKFAGETPNAVKNMKAVDLRMQKSAGWILGACL